LLRFGRLTHSQRERREHDARQPRRHLVGLPARRFRFLGRSGLEVALVEAVYAALVISDCDECGFNDLGKLLFGGLALAFLVGVGVSVLYWKKKGKQAGETGFVSIRANRTQK